MALLSIGVVAVAFASLVAFEMAFDLGGTTGRGGTVAGWWHPRGGPGNGSRSELLHFALRRSGVGPLLDTTEWQFHLTTNDAHVARPDPAMLTWAQAQIRADFASGDTTHGWPGDKLDPRPVALDLLSRGQLTAVIVDRHARMWNIVYIAILLMAALAAIHLLASLAMTIHDREFSKGRVVPALSRLHAAMLLSLCILLPATGLLCLFWFQLPDPWWMFAFAPLVVLVGVLSVCLPTIAGRLRRAARAHNLLCTACLYDLRDLPEAGRCPECGRSYEHSATMRDWTAVRHNRP
ncbi:MAG: hypothetical protein NCW75_09360 [Phycisphaera sp.]|nr:MAG: hypothetical protein NCW75_09360 [Phycisphaera sp.]